MTMAETNKIFVCSKVLFVLGNYDLSTIEWVTIVIIGVPTNSAVAKWILIKQTVVIERHHGRENALKIKYIGTLPVQKAGQEKHEHQEKLMTIENNNDST